MHAEYDDASLGVVLYDLRGCIDSVQSGHEDVHDHDIGVFGFRKFDSFASVAGFGDYFELITLLQLHAQTSPNNAVIVSDENSYAFHASTPPGVGISRVSEVPPRRWEATINFPFTFDTRSRMPINPSPILLRLRSIPTPSSST